MNAKANSIDHATHNRAVCNFLSKKKAYRDWVVTTAFYSALHFIDSLIFPFEEKGIKYDSVSSYKNNNPEFEKKSLHKVYIHLAKKHCSVQLSINYKSLYDSAHNARYVDYNISQKIADDARVRLKEIETECTS